MKSDMMVLGEYVCEIPLIGGNASSHITANSIISMTIHPGNLLNVRVQHMHLARYLTIIICIYISWTCSATGIVLQVDLTVILFLIFSRSI